jgi:hypothetical protein
MFEQRLGVKKMGMCPKCTKITGLLFLLAGLLLLLKDVGVWSFWGLEWATVLFIILGLVFFAKSSCPDCCSMPGGARKK